MKYEPIPTERILAIDPISKGFGFVVLESDPLQLVDWGTSTCRRTDDSLGETVRMLLARYRPTAIVLEAPSTCRSHTRRLALTASVAIIADAVQDVCPIRLIERDKVVVAFVSLGAFNKRQRVELLMERFPELAPKVPPPRFIWQSEDARWAVFDALALAVCLLEASRQSGPV